MKLTLTIAATMTGLTLLGGCATDPGYVAYTGENQPLVCRQEKRLGSNLKTTRCDPARDDAAKLEMIGTISR